MDKSPIVGVVMGSDSDWPTMKQATDILAHFDIPLNNSSFLHIAPLMIWLIMEKLHVTEVLK